MTDFDDDITEDLTIDGADLLAELQAQHARENQVAEPIGDVTIDGRDLLASIREEVAERSAIEPGIEPGIEPEREPVSEATMAREAWSPTPTLPDAEAVATHRAGRPSRFQLAVIGLVAAVSLTVGAVLIYGIVVEEPVEDESEAVDGEGE